MNEDLLVEGCGALAMPGGCSEGVFEIAIKSLNVPAHVIEAGQLGGGIKDQDAAGR